MDVTLVIQALTALAHERRLSVFRLLVHAGPTGLSAGIISGKVGISPASMSFHLKDLVRAGLIHQRHAGRRIFYSARFDTMKDVIGYLMENCWTGSNPGTLVCLPVTVFDEDSGEQRSENATSVPA